VDIVRGNQKSYESAVRRAADFNETQYDHALRTAAAQGKAVILVFGSSRSPASRQEMESIAQTKQQLGNSALIVHIDVDKVDPRSKIGEYVNQHVRPRGVPFTMVFDQRPDQNGNPIPQRPIDYFAGSADGAILNRRLSTSVARVGEIRQWDYQRKHGPYQGNHDLYNYYDSRSNAQSWQNPGVDRDPYSQRSNGQRDGSNYYEQPYRYPVYENECNTQSQPTQCGSRNYQRRFVGGGRVLSFVGRLMGRCR
jgi:thiol-disulfide isomerase/thioredoxin